jgi:hypothetical protein
LKGTIFAYTTFSPDMFNELNKILSVWNGKKKSD